MSLKWSDPVGFLKGATPTVRRAWESLGVKTIGDLLLCLPRRYDDFSRFVPIWEAQDGQVVTIKAKVLGAKKLPSFRKRFQMIQVKLSDGTGNISCTFFNQPWLLTELTPEREIVVSGKITMHPRYGKRVSNPLWEPAEQVQVAAGKIAPVYGLSGSLSQKTYRRLVLGALQQVEWPSDLMPAELIQKHNWMNLEAAIRGIHEPASLESTEQARKRLAYDEVLIYQLAMGLSRHESDQSGAKPIIFNEDLAKEFVKSLPFSPTDDQKKAMWAAIKDMGEAKPMRRLVQGDVGSGKTLVAAFLALQVQRAGESALILAPTDILASQHAETFRRVLAPFQIPICLVSRKEKSITINQQKTDLDEKALTQTLEQGNVIVIGTHAVLFKSRLPSDLALAIVDEQHRFGVMQREALSAFRRKDQLVPHFLSMTATPIPRSLALALYGGVEVSSIRQKPQGRLPIQTQACVGDGRELAYEAVKQAVKRGERAFIVCSLIDPSDVLGVRSATEEWKRLQKGTLAGLKIGMLHGRMKPVEKDTAMQDLVSGKLDVLVSTSVIEVGVDVPLATVILIEGAERFGLAQLHQLRGRVGRSSRQSYCYLLTDAQADQLERLKTLERLQDGLALAEEDLVRRGSGQLLGTLQSGHMEFQAARLSDMDIILAAREDSRELLSQDPMLSNYPGLKQKVDELSSSTHLE